MDTPAAKQLYQQIAEAKKSFNLNTVTGILFAVIILITMVSHFSENKAIIDNIDDMLTEIENIKNACLPGDECNPEVKAFSDFLKSVKNDQSIWSRLKDYDKYIDDMSRMQDNCKQGSIITRSRCIEKKIGEDVELATYLNDEYQKKTIKEIIDQKPEMILMLSKYIAVLSDGDIKSSFQEIYNELYLSNINGKAYEDYVGGYINTDFRDAIFDINEHIEDNQKNYNARCSQEQAYRSLTYLDHVKLASLISNKAHYESLSNINVPLDTPIENGCKGKTVEERQGTEHAKIYKHLDRLSKCRRQKLNTAIHASLKKVGLEAVVTPSLLFYLVGAIALFIFARSILLSRKISRNAEVYDKHYLLRDMPPYEVYLVVSASLHDMCEQLGVIESRACFNWRCIKLLFFGIVIFIDAFLVLKYQDYIWGQ